MGVPGPLPYVATSQMCVKPTVTDVKSNEIYIFFNSCLAQTGDCDMD